MAGLDALEKRTISSHAGTRTITSQCFIAHNAVVMLTDLSRNKFTKCKIKIRRQNRAGLCRTFVFPVVTSPAVCQLAAVSKLWTRCNDSD
jgi:hypothetical protein